MHYNKAPYSSNKHKHSNKIKPSLSARGWIPNYHGGWAMITLPIILGTILGGFSALHLYLFALCWIGYFAYFALHLWLRSGRKAKFFPPVRAYVAVLIAPAIGLGVYAPYILSWFVLFLPLLSIIFLASIHKKERSLLNDTATIVAACLMLPIAYDLGSTSTCFFWVNPGGLWGTDWFANTTCQPIHTMDWMSTWLITLLVCGYFIGTVFYIKTNIRERKSTLYWVSSVIFHTMFLILAFMTAQHHIVMYAHAYLWILLTLRSLFVPLYGKKRRWLSVKVIGIGEAVFSILMFITLM